MTPYKHAQSSALKFGGKPEDYIHIHEWFDETKAFTGDWTHRALRHHAAGIQWAIKEFGHSITNSVKGIVPVKTIAEQHVSEDCGYIPTIQDWFKPLAASPEKWMLRVKTRTVEQPLNVTEEVCNES